MVEKSTNKNWTKVEYDKAFGFVLPVGWGVRACSGWEDCQWVLSVVESGKVLWEVEGQQHYQHQGQVFFGAASCKIIGQDKANWNVIGITGGKDLAEALLGSKSFLLHKDADGSVWRSMVHLCYRLSSSQRQSPYKSSGRIYRLLLDLLEASSETHKGVSELVREAAARIERDFAYLGGVEDLADDLQVNKSHLIRCFSAQMGVTPGQYLQNVRLDYSKLLLCYKDYDLEMIADLLGYSGANYFCKVFRRRIGMTPGEYRQLNKVEVSGREPQKLLDWEKHLHC